MLNITEQYTQSRFEKKETNYSYQGTCDVKNNSIVNIQVAIYNENGVHIGSINNREDSATVSLVGNTKLEDLAKFSNNLITIKEELETILLDK